MAALLNNYHDGYGFAYFFLIVDPGDEIVPYRTVYVGEDFALRIDEVADGQPPVRWEAQLRRPSHG